MLSNNFSSRLLTILLAALSITASAYAGGVIELPQTGETKCYDSSGAEIACAGTGQDADIQAGVAWPSPRFTDNGDQTVTDNLTGLIWVKDANIMTTRDPGFDADNIADDGKVIWQHALNYVAKLNSESYLGHNDWRLPNVNELSSLVNVDEAGISTWLNTQGFSNVQADYYWSSSMYSGDTYSGWGVAMDYGQVKYRGKAFTYNVWPVRSSGPSVISLPQTGQTKCNDESGTEIPCAGTGQDGDIQAGVAWPSSRFTDNGDQTVTDNLTGLIWAKNADIPNDDKTWQEALSYIASLNGSNYLGFNDWRLPNVNELRSLVNVGEVDTYTWLNAQGFSNVESWYYWSSSTYATNKSHAWYVDMVHCYAYDAGKGDLNYVWPVRSEQVEPAVPLVSFSSPDSAEPGETLDITISGANFTGAEAIGFGEGITVITFTVISDTAMTATISIDLFANPGARDVTVTNTIGTESLPAGFTVTESAFTDTLEISGSGDSFSSDGGEGGITVTASAGVAWTAHSNDDWITIIFGASGEGDGVITYTVAENNTVNPITGTITVAATLNGFTIASVADIEDKVFTITQSGITPPINLADLTANSVTCPNKIKNGKKLAIKAVIKNVGKVTASASSVQFYLSANKDNSTIDGDTLLGSKSVRSLSKKRSQIIKYNWKANATHGTYYIKVKCDSGNAISESNEDNNIKVSKKITVK
ncbi:MAG: DUF1566 domain-containing protein [Candidatus Schekmanbacteria bacterium]|nr:DUF1566 domain-containing protein [Candidatus Schekmanbacteria bacterium]